MQNSLSLDHAPLARIEPPIIRALLVDDNEFDRKQIKRLSARTELRIDIWEAGSIQEMVQTLKSQHFDLILLDFKLEDGDGLQALDLLYANGHQPETRVIMITGNDETDIAVNAFRNGCQDFVAKEGLTSEKIRQSILRSLAGARSAQSLPDPRLKTLIAETLENSLRNSDFVQRIIREARWNDTRTIEGSAQIIDYLNTEDDDPFEFRN